MDIYRAMENRHSNYSIGGGSLMSDTEIENILKRVINSAPSAFNSQSSRTILLLGESHIAFWKIVMDTLRRKVPADKFQITKMKIESFAAGYGTVLYYEDMDIVKNMQEKFPSYSDNFPVWSQQSSGMLQFAVWIAFASEGFGASLQHYNPIIDEETAEKFDVPKNWKLIAQMPFGESTVTPKTAVHDPIEEHFFVKY